MEVHPPHQPIHTVKDFFLHLFTITVGLLIALGLEASVENLHHRHQLNEARESIHAELAANQHSLEESQADFTKQQVVFNNMLAAIIATRAHGAPSTTEHIVLAGASLNRSSWLTAQSSGALTLMPYEETSRLADKYEVQDIFTALQTQTLNTFGPLLGALPGSNGRSVEGLQSLTPAQLDSLEEKIRAAQGQSRILIGAAGELEKRYKDAD